MTPDIPDPPPPALWPYVVTSAEDDGPGTLRDAIRQAVARSGGEDR